MSDISEKLRAAYESKGLSYQELANRCNVPRATIQRYVSGTTDRIDIDKLQEICKVLGIDAAEVIGWKKGDKSADLDERFGTLLKEEREKENLSLEEMADRLGTTPEILYSYESGERIPRFSTAIIWAVQLGIPIDEYDPQYEDAVEKTNAALNAEIIRLLSRLSPDGKRKAIDYVQLLLMSEGKQ